MRNFKDYARYYNQLYKDKDYKKEAAYVRLLIKRCAKNGAKDILDVGCGTGNHAFFLEKTGYRIVGIDKSAEMIEIAKAGIRPGSNREFYVFDSSKFSLSRKFDVAISLFHVISYLTADRTLRSTFKNIYRHLKKGGIFIFDFWFGPAVLTQKPTVRIKEFRDKVTVITRTVTPNSGSRKNTINVNYKLIVKDKRSQLIKEIREVHRMRYFFPLELESLLRRSGFEVLKALQWMSLKKALNHHSWSGLIVAKKMP